MTRDIFFFANDVIKRVSPNGEGWQTLAFTKMLPNQRRL